MVNRSDRLMVIATLLDCFFEGVHDEFHVQL